jgi:serine/threonine protein kinase
MGRIIHHDLKPLNVFLAKGNIIKLSDFGISRTLGHTTYLAVSAVGTPLYLSPEICMGRSYNMKSDMWSLGCILYETMKLKRPFAGANIGEITRRIMTQYSRDIRDLTVRLLAKRPSQCPTINKVFQLPLIRNKAIALLGKTLARVELGHSVFHGCKPDTSPAHVSDEVSLAINHAQDAPPGNNGDIYREMQQMAENLQHVLQMKNLIDVPEQVQRLGSGEFYFMGRKLCLKKVRSSDPLQFKIEAVRAFIEQLLGPDRVLEI